MKNEGDWEERWEAGPQGDGALGVCEGDLGTRWGSCNMRVALCEEVGDCVQAWRDPFAENTQGRSLLRGVPPRPAPFTPLRGSAAPLPEPSCRAAWRRVTARGRCLGSPVPPPLSIGLCCRRSAPLDSLPSAPWAWRSRLRTSSWPGARWGSCCRLRGGGGNGGCGGSGAGGRAWWWSRARPGSPSS